MKNSTTLSLFWCAWTLAACTCTDHKPAAEAMCWNLSLCTRRTEWYCFLAFIGCRQALRFKMC